MKLKWFVILAITVLFQSSQMSANTKCVALTKSHLHALIDSAQKSITLGKHKLELKNVCNSSCGEDCDLLLHGYEDATIINPVDEDPDIFGTCVYRLGANDHMHVKVTQED